MYNTVIVCKNLIYNTEHNNLVMKVGLPAGLVASIIALIAVVLLCALIYFILKNRTQLNSEQNCLLAIISV